MGWIYHIHACPAMENNLQTLLKWKIVFYPVSINIKYTINSIYYSYSQMSFPPPSTTKATL